MKTITVSFYQFNCNFRFYYLHAEYHHFTSTNWCIIENYFILLSEHRYIDCYMKEFFVFQNPWQHSINNKIAVKWHSFCRRTQIKMQFWLLYSVNNCVVMLCCVYVCRPYMHLNLKIIQYTLLTIFKVHAYLLCFLIAHKIKIKNNYDMTKVILNNVKVGQFLFEF